LIPWPLRMVHSKPIRLPTPYRKRLRKGQLVLLRSTESGLFDTSLPVLVLIIEDSYGHWVALSARLGDATVEKFPRAWWDVDAIVDES